MLNFFVIRNNSIILATTNYAEADKARRSNPGAVTCWKQDGSVPVTAQRAKNWVKDGYAAQFAAIA